MRPRTLRRRLILAGLGGVLAAATITTGVAKAEPAVGCQDDFWFVPFQSTRRTICDGAIRPDGSWLRNREFYTPAHNVPLTTYCSGGRYYSSCSTSGGYFQPRTSQGIEDYIVTPDTVLPDEPGHLVGGLA
jgi:hypothetical protein